MSRAAYMREYRKRRPLTSRQKWRERARALANSYRRRGLLVPLPCEVCGSADVVIYHEDPTYALVVRWLCLAHRRAVIEQGPQALGLWKRPATMVLSKERRLVLDEVAKGWAPETPSLGELSPNYLEPGDEDSSFDPMGEPPTLAEIFEPGFREVL